MSVIFEDEITENNLDFYQFGLHHDQFDLSLIQNQIPLTDHIDAFNCQIPAYPHTHPNDHVVPILGPTLPMICEDDCLSSMPPSKFMRLNKITSSPNCLFMDAEVISYLSGNSNHPLSVESSGNFNGNMFLGNEIQPLELDYKGVNGSIFCPDPLHRPCNPNELQASEITNLEADTLRVTSKLTTEERKEKIHRYMKKRTERNFSKKIKYACRKTLADSRPRVRGRFAKNDEYGENNRRTWSNHEEDSTDEEKYFQVLVKEEEENFESSDFFTHQWSEFMRNYSNQSWI
ncbi:hypothetical protein LXL04_003943 [Taraxacum kok-saghyz]